MTKRFPTLRTDRLVLRAFTPDDAARVQMLAVTLATDVLLIGAIALSVQAQHRRAELGYWLGVPYWNNGYCTEAARALIAYGFDTLGLHKITSRYIVGNGASERVMAKTGLRKEGELVDEVWKDGSFRSIGVYGLVRS